MKTIALITDFGMADGFVGTMKGVISSIAPQTKVIDISHESSPQHTHHAAFVLWSSYKYFPNDTIFVIVVDPGVGSDRRILLVTDDDGRIFLLPENGILHFILPELKNPRAFHIHNNEYWLSPVSSTFHGRDIFAPVAAHLASGIDLKQLGDEVELSIPDSPFARINSTINETEGIILHSDRFGNLITNLRPDVQKKEQLANFRLQLGNRTIDSIKKTYADGEHGELIAIIGSTGLIEISVRNSSAQQMLGLRIGDPVYIRNRGEQ